jgi:formylmethanofuran dehydrogenase subunit E
MAGKKIRSGCHSGWFSFKERSESAKGIRSMGCKLPRDLIDGAKRFHGHWCPGLAIGIRAAEVARTEVGRAEDEDVVAVVETDMCGVDAVQYLTGCTFGKGNLIHRDHGKNVFTFYRRADGKSVRIVTRPDAMGPGHEKLRGLRSKENREGLSAEEQDRMDTLRAESCRHIMNSALEVLFEIQPAKGPVPQKARIMESVVCEACGEAVMEIRTRRLLGRTLCIPCFEDTLNVGGP